ncbi:MAG: acyl carrier protein [Bacteroidales bacterium]|jgi:acyl carrier protein|nr:acyl carrier protein [Bacteroidales bacterium]MBQ2096872.1 acyl carrier protein [Bacteroidales bacterium]
MARTIIEETVKQFLVEELEIDANKLSMDAKMKDDLGIDSLDVADIVVIVEEKFGFVIKTEEMADIVTLDDFCSFIEQKTSK